MLFMVVEHFNQQAIVDIYSRVRSGGRSLPPGLTYVGSWVEANFGRCWQLMECDDAALLQEWVLSWIDLDPGSFEIIPVVPSRDTAAVVAKFLPPREDQP